MKLSRLLFALCLLLAFGSCKKENNSPQPVNNNGGGTTSPVNIPTVFSLSNVLQSNMVVQRGKPFHVWGKAVPNTKITVKVSWDTGTYTASASSVGDWSVSIPAATANANPQTITLKPDGASTLTLKNILIGDVWVCSGQSNMVYQVDSLPPFRGVIDYQAEIAVANYPNIRTLTIQPDMEANPSDTLKYPASWNVCSPQTVGDVSGVAYYFGRKLNISLNVPIGIIVSAVDGTSCEAWINSAGFAANPDISPYSKINAATQYYNGMINPLTNLSIAGFTWYQGENNKNNNPPSDYTNLNSALIVAWRNAFNQGALPFYLVQLPAFNQNYYTTNPPGADSTADGYAKFREAQANVLTVPNTGMAVTMDVGDVENQHPRDKKPVGERLALLALKNVYGQNVQCYGPQYLSYTTNGSMATINFVAGTADGLNTIGNLPMKQYFYVAGSDQIFYLAKATIRGSQIILTAPSTLTLPIMAIRYAFTVAPITNLQNSAALPMEPFRTDNWSN